MLLFSTYLTVVLLFTKEVESHDEKPTSLLYSLPSYISNFTSNIFFQSKKFLDLHNLHMFLNPEVKGNLSASNEDLLNITSLVSIPVSNETSASRVKSLKTEDSWLNIFTNGTKQFRPVGPLTKDQLSFLLAENEKQLTRALKKTKWKDKKNQKLLSKYTQALNREEEELEKMRQLDELYHLQNSLEEAEDEKNDAEIFRSIYTSVFYYKKTWVKRFFDKFTTRHRVKRDEEVVCYKDLGCFRDEGPFDYFDMLPNSPEEINTKFLLHTKENPKREQYLSYSNSSSILKSNFRPNRKTKVIIHGFGSSCHRIWVREMRETFLKMEDVNVICVQWEAGATTPNYVRAASNTRLVGAQVAVFLELTARVTNMSLDDVHLIGFSLGAHVSGYAGQRLPGIGRISGLDPAGPLFESFPPNMRLDASDAKFVDVIHTNADSLLWGGLGAYDPMGHVDFYPNGGRVQKGCKNLFVGGVSDILWPKEGDGRYLCNHRRGYKYFMESVVPVCKFPAFACRDYDTFLKGECFPCKDCGNMGYYADKSPGRGQMFLVTRDTEPFCANQYKMETWHSGGPPTTDLVSTQGRFDVTFVAHDGKNETINVTRDTGKKMHAGSRSVAIVVLHVALSVISNLQVQYTSYRGWLSSGFNRWAIDKMSIMSSSGKIQSFCHRGLTMESGLTMVFPLVPGDCNPRELTLHPLPVPWPGIDYNIQNGVHIFPSPPANHNTAVGPVYNYNTTSVSHVSPHNIYPHLPPRQHPPVIQPPKEISPPPSRPTGPSTTFSVIHDVPSSRPNVTRPETSISNENKNQNNKTETNKRFNVTTESGFNTSYSPMTEEEYLAWRDAPPPNLHSSSYIEIDSGKGTDKLPNVINTRQPVNIIPAPHLGKTNSLPQNSQDPNKSTKLEEPTINNNNKFDTSSNKNSFNDNHAVKHSEFPSDKEKNVYNKKNEEESKKDLSDTGRRRNKIESGTASPDLMIREDAQVTDINSSSYEKYDELRPEETELNHDYLSSFLADQADQIERGILKGNVDNLSEKHDEVKDILEFSDIMMGKKKIAEDLPFNSVIDGEVPFKERARAIKFHPTVNQSPVVENTKPETKHNEKQRNHPSSLPNYNKNGKNNKSQMISSETPNTEDHKSERGEHNVQSSKDSPFNVQHPSHEQPSYEKGNINPFSYEHYSVATPQSFNSFNANGHHTLPPTVLRPPGFKTNHEYQPTNHKFSFRDQQPHRFPPPPPPLQTTQYSNFYAQHRYYPRHPGGFQSYENVHENNGEVFSESSFVPLYDGRDPIFVPSESSSSYIHPPLSPHQHYQTFTPQTTKAPKRPFSPLSNFFSSLTQQRDGRSKRPLKALFFSKNEAPNAEPRYPFYVPSPSISPGLKLAPNSPLPNSPHFRKFALPTHLRAPPPTENRNSHHRSSIARSDIGRSLEITSSPNENNLHSNDQSYRIRHRAPQTHSRPTPKLIGVSPSYSSLPRAFVKASKANFIPIRISRSSQRRTTNTRQKIE